MPGHDRRKRRRQQRYALNWEKRSSLAVVRRCLWYLPPKGFALSLLLGVRCPSVRQHHRKPNNKLSPNCFLSKVPSGQSAAAAFLAIVVVSLRRLFVHAVSPCPRTSGGCRKKGGIPVHPAAKPDIRGLRLARLQPCHIQYRKPSATHVLVAHSIITAFPPYSVVPRVEGKCRLFLKKDSVSSLPTHSKKLRKHDSVLKRCPSAMFLYGHCRNIVSKKQHPA